MSETIKQTTAPGNAQNFLFKARTKDAFFIKVIAELFASHIKYAPFQINKNGIFLTQMDTNKQQLFELALFKENFVNFKLTVDSINFIVNAVHFYRMLKAIKKKDTITIFITAENPQELGISVEPSGEVITITTYIRITYNQPEEIAPPTGYENPIIATSKEFQTLKMLHNLSRSIIVSSSNGTIRFWCDNNALYKRKVVLGNKENEESTNDDEENAFVQNFTNQYITGLTKCAGQSGNVQIFIADENRPLKIKMKAGTLGDLIIYIKSKEMIDIEREEDQTVNDDEQNMNETESAAVDEE